LGPFFTKFQFLCFSLILNRKKRKKGTVPVPCCRKEEETVWRICGEGEKKGRRGVEQFGQGGGDGRHDPPIFVSAFMEGKKKGKGDRALREERK